MVREVGRRPPTGVLGDDDHVFLPRGHRIQTRHRSTVPKPLFSPGAVRPCPSEVGSEARCDPQKQFAGGPSSALVQRPDLRRQNTMPLYLRNYLNINVKDRTPHAYLAVRSLRMLRAAATTPMRGLARQKKIKRKKKVPDKIASRGPVTRGPTSMRGPCVEQSAGLVGATRAKHRSRAQRIS